MQNNRSKAIQNIATGPPTAPPKTTAMWFAGAEEDTTVTEATATEAAVPAAAVVELGGEDAINHLGNGRRKGENKTPCNKNRMDSNTPEAGGRTRLLLAWVAHTAALRRWTRQDARIREPTVWNRSIWGNLQRELGQV